MSDTATWVDVPSAARLMGVHPHTVRAMIRAGELPATRLVRQFRIRRSDLDARMGACA